MNRLPVCHHAGENVYLDGGSLGPILLHETEGADCALGDELDVFVYHGTGNQLQATLRRPHVLAGEFAYLTVVSLTPVGAFLDWGLDKDLLLPYGEQRYEVSEGKKVLVHVLIDKHTQRVIASTRVDKFLREESTDLKAGDCVDLLVTEPTPIGVKAIVNNQYWGILYKSELFRALTSGQRVTGFIKKIRDDSKIDLTLYEPGYAKVAPVCEQIIEILKANDGFMMMTDKSPPEAVYAVFKVSKKVYKKALGALYRQRRIAIERQGIRLID